MFGTSAKIRFVMVFVVFAGMEGLISCKEDTPGKIGPFEPDTTHTDTTGLDDRPIDFSQLNDTYGELATKDQVYQWRHYNTHDPSILVDDEFTYSYSTDVAFGHAIRPGLQIRRSLNLVEWEFVGWVFNSIPSQGADYITQNGGVPNQGLWAPYAMKVGDEYRVYYSLASNVGRLSAIGLATSDGPRGPFKEKGVVVTSLGDNSIHTNAIDPSVMVDKSGNYWMYYGSSWDGIYIMELEGETGLAKRAGDKGVRIAHRGGFDQGNPNGNIEGAEIIYNEDQGMYYLFIAYDWLETKYNVRVGRSENADGPFFDYFGENMNGFSDNYPMVLAPYQFDGHSGWGGVSHPGVFEKDGHFYMTHQGRPGVNKYYMVMHTRQIFWTEDGWPLVSSQRFADEEETVVDESEIVGNWEVIDFDYTVVPGFAETQTGPDYQTSTAISLGPEGTIVGDAGSSWTYQAPWLTINWADGDVDKVLVERGRDWENEVESTILFTGINAEGLAIWGKKVN